VVAHEELKALSEKQIRFRQLQILGLVLAICRQNKITHGQMTSAKYLYMLDRIFDIKTYYHFKRGNLGPFPSDFKKTVANRQYFVQKIRRLLRFINEKQLFKYKNPNQTKIEKGVHELVALFGKYGDKERRIKQSCWQPFVRLLKISRHMT